MSADKDEEIVTSLVNFSNGTKAVSITARRGRRGANILLFREAAEGIIAELQEIVRRIGDDWPVVYSSLRVVTSERAINGPFEAAEKQEASK